MTETRKTTLAPVYSNVLEMIGNTPMLELTKLDTGPCRLFVKMESMNPGNSIKDRIAVSMIEAAEARGELKPGGLIVEATAGNTGLALALVGTTGPQATLSHAGQGLTARPDRPPVKPGFLRAPAGS